MRIIVISIVGSLTLSVRLVLSFVYSFYTAPFTRFKEHSLLHNTVEFPIFLGLVSFMGEMVPLLAFQVFLTFPINNRIMVAYHISFNTDTEIPFRRSSAESVF